MSGSQYSINLNGYPKLNNREYVKAKDTDYTLIQYIGLKDKNGVEIYEGDIVRCKHGWLGIVNYYSTAAHFACEEIVTKRVNSHGPIFDEWADLEIIGNIYENPELLEKQT